MKSRQQQRLYNKWASRLPQQTIPRACAIIGQKQPSGSGKCRCPTALDLARQRGFILCEGCELHRFEPEF